MTFPYLTYDRSVGSAVIGGPFYNATLYPAQYRGNFYFADYTGNFIKRIPFDAQHNPLGTVSFATDVAAPVSLAVGPDGMIYYLSFTTGQIRRIRFNGPVAVASGVAEVRILAAHRGVLERRVERRRRSATSGTSATGRPRRQPNPSHTYTASGVSTFVARLTVTRSRPVVDGDRPDRRRQHAACPDDHLAGRRYERSSGADDHVPGVRHRPRRGAARPVRAEVDRAPPPQHPRAHAHRRDRCTGIVRRRGPRADRHVLLRDRPRGDGQQRAERDHERHAARGCGPDAADGADQPRRVRPELRAGAALVDGFHRQRRGDRLPGRTLPGRGMRELRRGRRGRSDHVPRHEPVGVDELQLSRCRARRVGQRRAATRTSRRSSTPAAAPLPPGLVAAYSFDTGSGASVPDVSGNGNTGTAMGAFWSTQGRYGGAMSFDGVSSVVRVASSPSLALSSAMTLSGVDQPVGDAVGMADDRPAPDRFVLLECEPRCGLAASGGGWNQLVSVGGPTASPVGAWTHVALTYDGTMLRLYVNGTEVASRTASGQITASTSPLWIGGNSPFGEYFAGLIDDVRVYNRALTQAEIQTDLATPLGSSPSGDTTPPTAPTNLAASAVSATQVNLSWTAATDNVGRDRLPGRALPGRRLLDLHAGRRHRPQPRSTTRG